MAGTSLLTLLDDIANALDDIAVLTKVAAKKTAGVLGDDLALNAEQVSGVRADRELPVVLAVAKGSFRNKLILVPAALTISALIPWAISPLLMAGGTFLCFEGAEKIIHKLQHRPEKTKLKNVEKIRAMGTPELDLVALEQEKIKGAVRTDFILSAEIIVIVLGTVEGSPITTQIAVLSGIAFVMTIGVYSLVAGIIKLDDFGQHLIRGKENCFGKGFRNVFGRVLIDFAPFLMKALSVVGTAAMFLVGGGILLHGVPGATNIIHYFVSMLQNFIEPFGKILALSLPVFLNILTGILTGGLAVMVMRLIKRLTRK